VSGEICGSEATAQQRIAEIQQGEADYISLFIGWESFTSMKTVI
jgi:hypothetical protein